MEKAVHQAFTESPWPAVDGEPARKTSERRAAMRSVLERFVKGQAVRLNFDLKELGTRDKNNAMRGFFEFRSQGPMTETRLFGFFARHGAFVATSFRARDIFVDQADWDAECQQCNAVWNRIAGQAVYLKTPWPVETRTHLQSYLRAQDA